MSDGSDLQNMRAILRAELAEVRADIGGLKNDLTAVKTEMDAIKAKVDNWPDLHFLQAAAQKQVHDSREARELWRNMEIKLDEIYGSMATSSEITKLREEVSSSIAREDVLDLRISAIELRLGIKNPLAPTE